MTVLAVAIGVALVVAVRLMNAAVLASFLGTVDGLAGRAALTVTGGEGFTFDEQIVERLLPIPGIRLAVPLVRSVAFPDDSSGELLTVLGVDLTHEADVRTYEDVGGTGQIVDDLVLFLSRPDSIIAGQSWAARRGLSVGSQVALVTPSGVRNFTVRGLLDPRGLGQILAGRFVIMDLYAAERAFTTDGQINQIDIVLADGADVGAAKMNLEKALPAGLVVEEPTIRRDVVRSSVAAFQGMVAAFALLAVLGGFVICYSRLRTLFEARTWEVGLFRTIGLRRSVVFLELIKEGLLLGAAGIAFGVPLGVIVARWALPFIATATAINFRLPIPVPAHEIDGLAIAIGAAVGLGAAVLAALGPALTLTQTQPVAALRLKGREGPAVHPRTSAVIGSTLFVASVASIVCQWFVQIAAIGNLATGLLVMSLLALTGPLVARSGPALARALLRLFGPVGRAAAHELSQQSRRASLAVATLGLGLGSILLFGILGWSFERSLVAQLTERFRADLIVNSPFLAGGWMAAPVRDEAIRELEAIPGVKTASGQHLTEIAYGRGTVSLFSYDVPCFRDPRVCRWPLMKGAVPDALNRVASGDALIVSTSFAREHRVRSGDTLSLASPSGPQTFLVAGIAREEPARAIIMSRERYAQSWNDRMTTWIHVVLDNPDDREAVSAAIERHLGRNYRVQVRQMSDFLRFLGGQVREAFRALYVMEAITLALVLIGIADALAAGVIDRTRQFGMMRAVGLRRSQLSGIIVLEGGVIGVLGLLVAVAAGFGLSLFWVYVQFPVLLGWNLEFSLPLEFIGVTILLGMLLCLAGSLGPAIHAAGMTVGDAVRTE